MSTTLSQQRDDAAVAAPESVRLRPVLERPFHLIVVLWGERFRNYFLNYCLPSLMAPGNIPALATKTPSKFLIATRPEDWAAMEHAAIFRQMARYVEPHYIEIPPCPPGKSGCEHMGTGHKLACELAYREQAYAAVLTPDCMLADGGLERLQELALAGSEIVITAALRFGEEPLFANLRATGVRAEPDLPGERDPLQIPCRELVNAAINAFHSHSASCEWGSSYFPQVTHCAWWRVPGEDGVLLHSLSWAPLLIDYRAFANHDTSAMEDWSIDGDYLYKNVATADRIHVVQDSDELFLVSWAPVSDRQVRRYPLLQHKLLGEFVWRMQFKAHFENSMFDPLKRKLFFEPVRWHSRPLNASWDAAERRAMQQINAVIAGPGKAARPIGGGILSYALSALLLSVRQARKVVRWLQARRAIRYQPEDSGTA
jgi:hypothetical protein